MNFVVQTVAILLMTVSMFAPMAGAIDCGTDHETTCETECVCLCHADPMIAVVSQGLGYRSPGAIQEHPADDLALERLSIDDVFRPPITA